MEVHAEYEVFDQDGRRLGAVREVGRNPFVAQLQPDAWRSYRLLVLDAASQVLLRVSCPGTMWKSTIEVAAADGSPLGRIVQKTLGVLHAARFTFEADGQVVGSLRALGRDTWQFSMFDSGGKEIGTVSKTWAGAAKEWFTLADHYVVTIRHPLAEPLRSLTVAAALAVDLTFGQDPSVREMRREQALWWL